MLEGWNLDSAPEHPWTVQQLLAGQAAAGRRVGMILDLSNHETLYADEIPAVLAYRHVQLVAKVRFADCCRQCTMFLHQRPCFAAVSTCTEHGHAAHLHLVQLLSRE